MAYLSDSELEEVKALAKISGIEIDSCPTCLTDRKEPIYNESEISYYRYEGEEHICDCAQQISLRKLFLRAHLPDQFQRLDLKDWRGDPSPVELVQNYIDNWANFKIHGIGLEFYSQLLGTGKSFLATHVGKELAKKGQDVYFIPFGQIINAFRYNDQKIIDKLYNTNILILDEIIAPPHDALADIFAERFEDVIRNRTNFNAVTICTTNLLPTDLKRCYPRTYSLLEAKQIRVEIGNTEDARQSFIAEKNLAMALNGERKPIC